MKFRKTYMWCGLSLCLLLPIVFRVWYLEVHKKEITSYYGSFGKNQQTFQGVIESEPVIGDGSQSFDVDISPPDESKEKRLARVHVTEQIYPSYRYGMRVELSGKLISPRNFSGFDYIHYLEKDGIYFLMKNPKVRVLGEGYGNYIVEKLFLIKRRFLESINSVLGEPYAALAGGLVVGEKSSLGKELLDDFRRAGLIHIVVLSGYNITVVADSIRKILNLFLPRTAGLCAGAVSIILFGILVGGGATVVRSCIMALVAITAQFFYRDYNVSRALFLAAYMTVVANPFIVFYDPSFQLSFLSTAGLILLASPIEKKMARWPRIFPMWAGIRSLIASTLATQIIVFPLLLYMMGQISLVGVLVNILVLPFIRATMLFVFLTGFIGTISHMFSFIPGALSHLFLSYELTVVNYFSHLPYAVLQFHGFSLWMMWLCYAGYAAIFIFFRMRVQNFLRSPPS